MIDQKILATFHEELDEVPTDKLPTDQEFAKEIVKDLDLENAMKAIEAYTWYYVCRINNAIQWVTI